MRKLILVATVAALAFVGQAASVDWKINYAEQGATWSGNGATVMAFAGSDYADIVKLVTVSGSNTLQSDLATYALGSASTFSNNRGSAVASVKLSDAPSSMFWMIFSDGSYDGGSAVTWTVATDVSGYQYTPPASGTALSLTATSFANSGTIATASVPEPTSGILLLVGMAGLALRRKLV